MSLSKGTIIYIFNGKRLRTYIGNNAEPSIVGIEIIDELIEIISDMTIDDIKSKFSQLKIITDKNQSPTRIDLHNLCQFIEILELNSNPDDWSFLNSLTLKGIFEYGYIYDYGNFSEQFNYYIDFDREEVRLTSEDHALTWLFEDLSLESFKQSITRTNIILYRISKYQNNNEENITKKNEDLSLDRKNKQLKINRRDHNIIIKDIVNTKQSPTKINKKKITPRKTIPTKLVESRPSEKCEIEAKSSKSYSGKTLTFFWILTDKIKATKLPYTTYTNKQKEISVYYENVVFGILNEIYDINILRAFISIYNSLHSQLKSKLITVRDVKLFYKIGSNTNTFSLADITDSQLNELINHIIKLGGRFYDRVFNNPLETFNNDIQNKTKFIFDVDTNEQISCLKTDSGIFYHKLISIVNESEALSKSMKNNDIVNINSVSIYYNNVYNDLQDNNDNETKVISSKLKMLRDIDLINTMIEIANTKTDKKGILIRDFLLELKRNNENMCGIIQ